VHRRSIRFALACACLAAVAAAAGPGPAPARAAENDVRRDAACASSIDVARGERLVVIAPHPDDEVIATAGLIQRVVARGGTALVVPVTAGDGYASAVRHDLRGHEPQPADFVAYGERRLGESRAGLRALAGERVRLLPLGFPDGGLAALLHEHWQPANPVRSSTTAASDPPYDREVLEPNVRYSGADLRRELASLLRSERPTMIALPDPRDVHPDHRAAGIFALLAIDQVWQPELARRTALPKLLGYLVHWPDWPPGWDAACPAAAWRHERLLLPETFVQANPRRATATLALGEREVERKGEALARHATQQEVMPVFLAAFVRRTEPFTCLTSADVVAAASESGHHGTEHARRREVLLGDPPRGGGVAPGIVSHRADRGGGVGEAAKGEQPLAGGKHLVEAGVLGHHRSPGRQVTGAAVAEPAAP
jgi:LmbE family N-acetylglucosaminyl deacetylase